MAAPDVRVSIWNPSFSTCELLDAVSAGHFNGGQIQYEDTPAGCGSGKLILGLRYEEMWQSGVYAQLNGIEISTGDDTLQTAITAGATKIYVGSTLPYDSAHGADIQQIYLYDGVHLTMGIPVTGTGTDGGGAYLTIGTPRTMPGNPATIPAYGTGTIVGRRRYAGIVRLCERPNQKLPAATVTLGPLSSAFSEAVGGYTVGVTAGCDVGFAVWTFLNQFSGQWPQLTISQSLLNVTVGSVFSGSETQCTADQMLSDALQAIAGVASALTANTSAGANTSLPVTAGTGTLFSAGAQINVGSGADAETCTVVSSTANAIVVASTANAHTSGEAVTTTASSQWYVRVGHDRTPRLIQLYSAQTNGYAYPLTLTLGTTAFEPVNVDITDQDAQQFYNRILVYGNTNPATQQPYSAIVEDAASFALVGRWIDGNPVTVSSLNSNTACAAYGQQLLDQFDLGQQHGTCRVYTRNDFTVDVMPIGLPQGDVVRGVNCLILAGLDAGGTSVNYATDSDILAPQNWTENGLVFVETGGPGTSNAFEFTGTGAAVTKTATSPPFYGAAGRTFSWSAWINAGGATAGTLTATLVDDQGVTRATASQAHGTSAQTTPQTVVIPGTVKTLSVVYSTNGATIGNGSTVAFSRALLVPYGAPASTYVPNYGAPNVFGLVSSVVSTIDMPSGDRWQDVQFSPIEPDWVAAMQQLANAKVTALAANAPPGSSQGQYAVSADAYPPGYSTGSLVLSIPGFAAIFALGSTVYGISSINLTLPASATSWILAHVADDVDDEPDADHAERRRDPVRLRDDVDDRHPGLHQRRTGERNDHVRDAPGRERGPVDRAQRLDQLQRQDQQQLRRRRPLDQ